MSDKQLVLEMITRLPEGVTIEEISDRLELMIAVRDGLHEIERGDVISHKQVKKQLAAWLSK